MKKIGIAYRFIKHWLGSSRMRREDSPFVFDLWTNAIHVKTAYYSYPKIEKLRAQLLSSKKTIKSIDLGANRGVDSIKRISEIAKHAAKSPKQAQLLFRLVNYFQPKQILELGTSLGISTSYLASANSKAKIISLEGCPETATLARQHFKHLKLKNIEQEVGDFETVLPKVLATCGTLDFVFFDGNHRKAATINYFNQCLENSKEHSVFVVDDIYWSTEMTTAWEEIKKHKAVTISIDLFYMGIVFFHKEKTKQHFSLRF